MQLFTALSIQHSSDVCVEGGGGVNLFARIGPNRLTKLPTFIGCVFFSHSLYISKNEKQKKIHWKWVFARIRIIGGINEYNRFACI